MPLITVLLSSDQWYMIYGTNLSAVVPKVSLLTGNTSKYQWLIATLISPYFSPVNISCLYVFELTGFCIHCMSAFLAAERFHSVYHSTCKFLF